MRNGAYSVRLNARTHAPVLRSVFLTMANSAADGETIATRGERLVAVISASVEPPQRAPPQVHAMTKQCSAVT